MLLEPLGSPAEALPCCRAAVVAAAAPGIAALAVVYVASKDPDHRGRAWQLLKFLLRR